MSDDLVKRLRNVEPEGMVDHKWRLIDEAADRIEALTVERDAAQARADALAERVEAADELVTALRTYNAEGSGDAWDAVCDKVQAYRATEGQT